MSDEKPLSDNEVYELLHAALLTLMNRTVETTIGRDILATAIRDLTMLQSAMIIMREGDGTTGPREPQPSNE